MKTTTNTNTSSLYFKALTILCYAMAAGIVLFSIIVFALIASGVDFSSGRHGGSSTAPLPALPFEIVAIILAVGGLLGGNTLFNTKVAATRYNGSLLEKTNAYRAAVILRYALLEGPALFSVIVCLLTGQIIVLVITAIMVAVMLYSLPSKERLISDLQLSFEETNVINDPDGIIG